MKKKEDEICIIPSEHLDKMMRLIEKRAHPVSWGTHHKNPDIVKLLELDELTAVAPRGFIEKFGPHLIGETGRYHIAFRLKRLEEFWNLAGKIDRGFDFIIAGEKFEIKTGILTSVLWKDYRPLVFTADWDPRPSGYIFTTWRPPFESRLISALSMEKCLSEKRHIRKGDSIFVSSRLAVIRTNEESELFPKDLELAYKIGLLQRPPKQLGFDE